MLPSWSKGHHMASAAQVIANQANAQLSTGPLTPEGKARVSQNALRHGLTARHLVIRPDELDEFASLHPSLIDELAPRAACLLPRSQGTPRPPDQPRSARRKAAGSRRPGSPRVHRHQRIDKTNPF